MLTPEEIEGRDFLVSLRGFDRAEVQAFLSEVADQVRDLEARSHAAETAQAAEIARATEIVEAAAARAATAEDQDSPVAAGDAPATFADIGRETQRILESAHEAAQSILQQARVDADREVQDARRRAARLIAEGEQRREETEEMVAGLEAARGALSTQLREIETTVGRVIGELAAPPLPAATVREALTAEAGRSAAAATERAERPKQPGEPERFTRPERSEPAERTEGARSTEPAKPEPAELQEAEQVEREEEGEQGEQAKRQGVPPPRPEAEQAEQAEPPPRPEAEQAAAPPGRPEPAGQEEPSDAAPPDADAGAAPPAPKDRHAPDQPDGAGGEGRGRGTDVGMAEVVTLDVVVDEPSDPLGLRGSALAPLHPLMVRPIKRGLQDMQNVALDRLRRTGGEGEPESLLPADEQLDAIGAAAADVLHQAYEAGLGAASLLVDRELPQPTAERTLVDDFVADAAQRMSSPLAATLRMARSAGEGAPALLDRVGAVFAELKGSVAEELAATHLTRAYELGLVDAWAAGGVTHRRWVLGREPRCPEARCRHNDQAGVVAIGDTYPSGHEVPPIHVGCNCTTTPVSEPPA